MAKKKKGSKPIIMTIVIIIIVAAVVIVLNRAGLIRFTETDTDSERIIAIVDGNTITQGDLDKQYELFLILITDPAYEEQITKEMYLDQMVVEMLMLKEAEDAGVSPLLVSDEELKSSLGSYFEANRTTGQDLVENLVSKGLTIDDLRAYFKTQIALNNFLNNFLLGLVEVTDEEVMQLYEQNSEIFTTEEIYTYLYQQKQILALQAYLEQLRSQADIEIKLED